MTLNIRRGQIWFAKVPTDPPDKGPRPVIIVSTDDRNQHPRAGTVLVVPMTTSIQKHLPSHIQLAPGETGLSEPSAVKAEELTVLWKESLIPSRVPLRNISSSRICQIAHGVAIAMGCAVRD